MASASLLIKHVQEMSIDGDEPPPRYLVKEGKFGAVDPSPPLAPIPLIDLSLLFPSSCSTSRGLAELQKLETALSTWGCFQAVGHGIPSSFLDKVRELAKQFFDLPMEEKEKYARPVDDIQGYGNDPILSDKQVLDWSDRLLLSLIPEDSRKLELWPQKPSEFSEVLSEYSAKVKPIAHLLHKAMARSLKLSDEDCFLKQYGGQELVVARFNYYPICPKPDAILGVKAHSDGSGITILLQDKEVGGLQVLKDDQWSRVPIIPHALLVNAGDQMQIMSNGIFKSPLHRVSASRKKERISIAIFFSPNQEVEIGPEEELINENSPQQYRRLKNYVAINFECFQNGKVALDEAKI